jgi:hypothetical protein
MKARASPRSSSFVCHACVTLHNLNAGTGRRRASQRANPLRAVPAPARYRTLAYMLLLLLLLLLFAPVFSPILRATCPPSALRAVQLEVALPLLYPVSLSLLMLRTLKCSWRTPCVPQARASTCIRFTPPRDRSPLAPPAPFPQLVCLFVCLLAPFFGFCRGELEFPVYRTIVSTCTLILLCSFYVHVEPCLVK